MSAKSTTFRELFLESPREISRIEQEIRQALPDGGYIVNERLNRSHGILSTDPADTWLSCSPCFLYERNRGK